MMRTTHISVTLALALATVACTGAAPEPTTEVLQAMPDMLDPASDATDDLTIIVAYRDGDGDLGGGTAAVHDCRADAVTTVLELPEIASMEAVEAGVPIEGELEIIVTDVGDFPVAAAAPAACAELGVGAPVAGEAVFCVELTDAAGNTGPGDCTPTIAIASN